MISNIFEFEELIEARIRTVIGADAKLYVDEESNSLKADVFRGKTGDDRVAVALRYEGFQPNEKMSKSSNKLLDIMYRVIVVTPISDKTLAGTTMAGLANALADTRLRNDCLPIELIKDVREFNTAQYGDGMMAVPLLISFKVTL